MFILTISGVSIAQETYVSEFSKVAETSISKSRALHSAEKHQSSISQPDDWSISSINTTRTTEIDNKGTEFWLVMERNNNLNVDGVYLDITSDVVTTGYVEIPGLDYYEEFSVKPDSISRVQLPDETQLYYSEEIEYKGIHVVSEEEITIYGMSLLDYSTDGYLALPLDILSTNYMVMSYPHMTWKSSLSISTTLASQFAVVSPYDNVTVTITPSCKTASGIEAGESFEVVLNKGEAYQVQAYYDQDPIYDLTGSVVQSTLPVAVFSGSAAASVPADVSASDHLIEQLPPISTWGNNFIAYPLEGRQNGDTWRIISATDSNLISFNNSIIDTLNFGDYYETILEEPAYINSTEPVMVMQYANGDSYDPGLYQNGDPFMMLIPPVEQFMNSYTFSTPEDRFTYHYLSIIVPEEGVGAITLDDVLLSEDVFDTIENSGYCAVGLAIEEGTHSISSDLSDFGIYSYGFARYESYGCAGGLSLKTINTNEGPEIIRTKETMEYDRLGQQENVFLSISAYIIDTITPYVQNAYLYYKSVIDSVFDTISMSKSDEGIWTAQIPADSVVYPGIVYYYKATDGQLTSYLPSVDAENNPFNIAVLPNIAPTIQHTPVISSDFYDSILISAKVYDSTNYIENVYLAYRNAGGNPIYNYVPMELIDNDTYQAYIPAKYVTEQGTEYYIKAIDDFGLTGYFYSADNPITINLDGENNAPSLQDSQFTTDELPSVGTTIGTLNASDVDTNQVLVFSIVDGNTDGAFTLDPYTGELIVNNSSSIEFDKNPVFNIHAMAIDNGSPTLSDTALVKVYINNPSSINNLLESDIQIYPNPSKGEFKITNLPGNSGNVYLSVITTTGQTIFNTETSSTSVDISLDSDYTGVCFLIINNVDGMAVEKLVIE